MTYLLFLQNVVGRDLKYPKGTYREVGSSERARRNWSEENLEDIGSDSVTRESVCGFLSGPHLPPDPRRETSDERREFSVAVFASKGQRELGLLSVPLS